MLAESRQVGMIFQDYGLFPHMTVAKNIAYGLRRITRSRRKQRVKDMLHLVHIEESAHRLPTN